MGCSARYSAFAMRESITESVRALCEEQGATLLLLCLTGSRAYGCNGASSDYDVRFVYVYPPARYFELIPPPDELRLPDGDVLGFELGKFLRIIRKSGWNAHELLHAPAWYAHPCVEEMRALCEAVLSAEPMAHGLLSGAHVYLRRLQYLPEGEAGTMRECKLCIGALRMMLAAAYVLEQQRMFPICIKDLVLCVGTAAQRGTLAELVACRTHDKLPPPELLAGARVHTEQLFQELSAREYSQEMIEDCSPLEEFYLRVVMGLA